MPKVSSPEITHRSFHANVQETLRMTKRYMLSYYQSRTGPALFENVRTFCMFVGHARSGGSIMGALLDAHPNILFGDEVDTLRYVAAGFSREQIYHLILDRSLKQAQKGRIKSGREGKDYSYLVPGQWQGRFTKLQVVGDSKAGFTTQRLAQNPALLQRLQNTMPDVDITLLQIIRNPYDTISTMNIRSGRPLENGINRYFSNCETIANVQKRLDPANVFLVRHEEFVTRPRDYLNKICEFLGVEAGADYLDACATIIHASPAKSRHKIQWTPDLINSVQGKIHQFDFLTGYSYQE